MKFALRKIVKMKKRPNTLIWLIGSTNNKIKSIIVSVNNLKKVIIFNYSNNVRIFGYSKFGFALTTFQYLVKAKEDVVFCPFYYRVL